MKKSLQTDYYMIRYSKREQSYQFEEKFNLLSNNAVVKVLDEQFSGINGFWHSYISLTYSNSEDFEESLKLLKFIITIFDIQLKAAYKDIRGIHLRELREG